MTASFHGAARLKRGLLLTSLALAEACAGEDFKSCSDASCANTTTGGASVSGGTNGGNAGTSTTSVGGTGGTTTTGESTTSVGGTGGVDATGGMGGTMAGAGGAGGAPAACDEACSDPTPVCDEATDTCVECLDSAEHCSAPTPACDPDRHECVECVETADCDAGVCDTEAQKCVDCLESDDCEAPTALCDTEQQQCVECLGNADCKNPLEALCDAGSCSPCQTNADCEHLTGTTVCDVAAGECVECTGTDYESCGRNTDDEPLVCDSLTRTCTEQVEHGAGLCNACVSDANCALGELCVMHTFQEQELGYFCFWKEGDTDNGAPPACGSGSRPYVEQLSNSTSIDGQMGNICGLRTSTCVARQQFSKKECGTITPDNSLCGAAPPADAVCAAFSTTEQLCTMTCLGDQDCPVNSSCIDNVGIPYCDI